MIIYGVVLVYISNSTSMLIDRFGFTKSQASLWYTTPYMISAGASPFLGLLIDKIGKRAFFITFASVMILLACIITQLIPTSEPGKMQPLIFIPLILLGFGYSVYAAAMWGSVPYTCEPKQIATAYGLCTAIQNIGMTISPLIAGSLLGGTKKDDGYFWYLVYFELLGGIGLCLNLVLYFDDIKNRGGVLNRVDKVEELDELMATPTVAKRDKAQQMREELAAQGDDSTKAALLNYKTDKTLRDSLRRSVGQQEIRNL